MNCSTSQIDISIETKWIASRRRRAVLVISSWRARR